MKFFLTCFTALSLLAVAAVPARADYFVWQDAASGVSFSFPDTWKIVSSSDQNDALTIMAPSGRAHAACRVRVDLDRRYVIFPPSYREAIQKADFSLEFWEQYLGEYENPVIYEVVDGAGLGRSYAGYTVAGYKSAVQGPYMDRMALIFASLYNDKLYVLECSSHHDAFAEWKDMFMSIAKSVDYNKAYQENVTGNYRDFLSDKPVLLPGDLKKSYIVQY